MPLSIVRFPSGRPLAALAALGALSAPALVSPPAAGAAPTTYVPHDTPPGSVPLPFSDAVLAGDTLYVAGHIGFDARGNVPADADIEAKQVMDAVKHTLEAAGLTMEDFVSVTVFCTDLALYDRFNAVYRGYFHGHYPARAFIGADRLLRGAHFEVMGVAVRVAPR
jgi:2-iminobutanoate/2-iminopropanoate deaminase